MQKGILTTIYTTIHVSKVRNLYIGEKHPTAIVTAGCFYC